MKQGWQIKAFSEISHSIDDGDWIEKKDQSETGIRLIQTGNIGVGQYRDKAEKAKFISEDTFKRLKCTEIVCGDILVSRLPDPVGRACILPSLPYKCITAVDCSIIKLKENVIHPSWFVFYTQSQEYFAKVRKECSGTTRDRISRKKLEVITIPVPPLSEQQRIVALLDAEFAKIDALKANAEKNLQNAKDLFQAALKKELEPKEGWKTKRIEEIAEIKGGKRVPKGYKLITERTTHPYIRVSDFNDNGSVDLGDIHYIEDWVYKEIQRYTISFKDVYISIAGTIGKSGIIPKELEGANLTENACKLVLNQGLYNRYIYYCTINDPFKSQIVKLTMQAAQPKLALTRLATATISIPSLEDQQSIVARLDALNEKCKTLQANYEKTLSLCDDLKQALLRSVFGDDPVAIGTDAPVRPYGK